MNSLVKSSTSGSFVSIFEFLLYFRKDEEHVSLADGRIHRCNGRTQQFNNYFKTFISTDFFGGFIRIEKEDWSMFGTTWRFHINNVEKLLQRMQNHSFIFTLIQERKEKLNKNNQTNTKLRRKKKKSSKQATLEWKSTAIPIVQSCWTKNAVQMKTKKKMTWLLNKTTKSTG